MPLYSGDSFCDHSKARCYKHKEGKWLPATQMKGVEYFPVDVGSSDGSCDFFGTYIFNSGSGKLFECVDPCRPREGVHVHCVSLDGSRYNKELVADVIKGSVIKSNEESSALYRYNGTKWEKIK